jgi:hypothetical protein
MIGMARFHFEVVAPYATDQRLRKIARYRRQARALEDLSAMEREAGVETLEHRHGGENDVVARAPRDDHFGARIERAHERLYTHLRDDRTAAIYELRRQRRRPDAFERRLTHAALEIALVDFGADDRHAKRIAVLARDVTHQLDRLL